MLGSVLLHGALAVALVAVTRISFDHPARPQLGPSIEAVAVDSRLLQNHQQAQERKAAEARERERQRVEEQQRQQEQQRAEQQRLEEQARQAEQQRLAAQKATQRAEEQQATALKAQHLAAQKVEAAKALAASKAATQAAAAKAAVERQQAAALADKQRADAARAAADEKAHQQRETELRRQMAEEERLSALQSGPQQASYIASIQSRISRAWLRPASARPGIVCRIQVVQIPGGEVTSVRVTDCNGDEAVRQSVENAVYRASPLPEPPDPALFQRNLTLVFKPND